MPPRTWGKKKESDERRAAREAEAAEARRLSAELREIEEEQRRESAERREARRVSDERRASVERRRQDAILQQQLIAEAIRIQNEQQPDNANIPRGGDLVYGNSGHNTGPAAPDGSADRNDLNAPPTGHPDEAPDLADHPRGYNDSSDDHFTSTQSHIAKPAAIGFPRLLPTPRKTFWLLIFFTLLTAVRNFMHWPHAMPNCLLYQNYYYCFSSCSPSDMTARFASIHHAAYDKPAFFNSTIGETIQGTVQRVFYAETDKTKKGRWYRASLQGKIPYQAGNGPVRYRRDLKPYCPATEEWNLVRKGLELKGQQEKVRVEMKGEKRQEEMRMALPGGYVDRSREVYEAEQRAKREKLRRKGDGDADAGGSKRTTTQARRLHLPLIPYWL